MLNRTAQLGFFGVLAMGALSLPSCTADQEALLVTNAFVIEQTDEGFCAAGSTILSRDVLDVSFNTGYTAAFSVLNNLTQTGVDTNSGVEGSEMKLTDVIVELSMPSNPEIISGVTAMEPALTRFSTPIATTSFSGQELYTTFVVVPPESITAIGAEMVSSGVGSTTMIMSVIFRAQRSSNSGAGDSGIVESRSFELPINVCAGTDCLRNCPGVSDGSCSIDECNSGVLIGSGGVCGNAQSYATAPLCCDGNPSNDLGMCG
jgi:hypothetical protein